MPREQITYNRIVPQRIEAPTYAGTEAIPDAIVHQEEVRRNVHVQWNRTGGSGALNSPHDIGWVQIALDLTVADLRGLLAAAEAAAVAEAHKHAEMGELDTEQYQFRVTSDVLDRHETNLAIAMLRRARDAAYGKDA